MSNNLKGDDLDNQHNILNFHETQNIRILFLVYTIKLKFGALYVILKDVFCG